MFSRSREGQFRVGASEIFVELKVRYRTPGVSKYQNLGFDDSVVFLAQRPDWTTSVNYPGEVVKYLVPETST